MKKTGGRKSRDTLPLRNVLPHILLKKTEAEKLGHQEMLKAEENLNIASSRGYFFLSFPTLNVNKFTFRQSENHFPA